MDEWTIFTVMESQGRRPTHDYHHLRGPRPVAGRHGVPVGLFWVADRVLVKSGGGQAREQKR